MDSIHLKPYLIYFFYSLVEETKDPSLVNRYRSVISETEKTKTDRYVFEKDQHRCLITRALVRFVLSACTGRAPEGFEFMENAYGKPALKPNALPQPIRFNLSHCDGMVACAVTLNNELGVDIENQDRKIDLSLADRYFTKAEADYVRTRPAEERSAAFFDIWTLKESYIKAKGMGLSIDLDKFGFEIEPQTRISFDASCDDRPDRWQFFRFSPMKNYKAAISVEIPTHNAIDLRAYKCIPFIEIKRITLAAFVD